MDTIDRAAEYEERERLARIPLDIAGNVPTTRNKHMRTINLLVIHCSATAPSADIGADTIRKWHRAQGWQNIGYHYVIRRDGTLEPGRPEAEAGAHVKGHNAQSLGICLVGGVDGHGNPEPNYTAKQLATLKTLIQDIKSRHNIRRICGHRDLSPDRDGDGIVEPHEWIKYCPCFDVETWLRTGQLRDQGKLYPPHPHKKAPPPVGEGLG